ncbi:MAG: acyltransferase family protein [Cyanobacteria bacterium SZAS LIN-3]|nr:acyltransferase family protein [Cyanobacteria bacterium SZAS LIN-3]MBS2006119.1 acyltransferase family protein [Cyanobacteria bacterium SZAS TMP-1]
MTTMPSWKSVPPKEAFKVFAQRNPTFVNRYSGEEDEFGFDMESFAVWEPFFRFLYEEYFRVTVRGIENIPSDGRGILIGNHSGLLPVDAAMMAVAMCHVHKSPRRIRYLVTDWFFSTPMLGEWTLAMGQVRASLDNARVLLDREELIGIYPEGVRGVGKPFRERYRVLDFHPGFVQLAIATQTPLIPVATIGGDEIYPEIVNVKSIARALGMPFFPITPGFPWLPFPLMLFPLPVRWMIHVHKPIDLGYPPEKASDRRLVLKLAREIQYEIQRDLNRMFKERRRLFTSPDGEEI